MSPKRYGIARYQIHGVGLSTLGRGLDEIGVPEERREMAKAIIREVMDANDATTFYWYVPPKTGEVSCYWDDADQNLLWINPGEVHVPHDESLVRRPGRPTTWSKQDGLYVGWLLPGASSGTGGGAQKARVATVWCPETFIPVPAGVVCHHCDVVHEADQPS